MEKSGSYIKEFLKGNILSVSVYLKLLNSLLNSLEARIKGEISEIKKSSAGHVYFSLKDKKDNSVIKCVIWAFDYKICGLNLKEGLEVIAQGSPDVYTLTGNLNFKVKTIQLVGEGEIKKEYEKLKKKLEEQGVFDEKRKKPLPFLPKNIGIITSKQGAVINDFLTNLGQYGFNIKLIDSRVEGIEAVKDLINSIKTFKKHDLDVLVIMRGGGSMESFLAFNNELLIKEIINLPFPVIAGLGHEKDVPLLALAADKMVSTPSIAANLINSSWQELEWEIKRKEDKIFSFLSSFFEKFKLMEYKVKQVLTKKIEKEIDNIKMMIERAEKIALYNNPERNLKLGYCLAFKQGKLIKQISQVKKYDLLDLQVLDGIIETTVKKTKRNERKKFKSKS